MTLNLFHSIDYLLFTSLVLTYNYSEAKIYYNIIWSIYTLLLICILSFFLEKNTSNRGDTRFYFIHNLTFPFLLFSIASRENNFDQISNYSIISFSTCMSISSIFIYKVKNTYSFKKWPTFFFKTTLFTLFFLFVIVHKCDYQIKNVGLLAIIYYISLLQFLLNTLCKGNDCLIQFGELNIFSQFISFLLLISLSNIKRDDPNIIYELNKCINYITMVVALLIPVNIFAIEVLLSSQITHYGSKRNALYKYLAFPAMCTLCTLLYYMVKYTYGITAFIMKMLVESKVIKQLIAYWVFTIICLPILLKKVGRLKLDSKAKKIFTRKTFHLFLIVLFSPQIISFKITPNHEYQAAMEFTIISIYVASSAFIYLEVVRKCQNGELTNFINGILVPFLDNKDNANSIIITHICLLVGISIPIFKEFLLRKGTSDFDVVSATLGIATIGVGDALSAILGCLYGRIYLPGNRDKTLIGMIAFFVSTCSFLQFTCYFSSNHYSLPKIFLISFFSSLLESYSHYIDNATIPMYSLTLYTNIR